jgi:hypothetical protein
MSALAANFTSHADAPRISFVSCGAGYASRVFNGLAHRGDCRRRLSAIVAWSESVAVTRFTNAIIPAICFAFDASVLCHIAIVPQLPDLENSYAV